MELGILYGLVIGRCFLLDASPIYYLMQLG